MVSNPVECPFGYCGERTVMQSTPVQYTTEVIVWYEALAVGVATMAAAARMEPASAVPIAFLMLKSPPAQ